jgi:hypothetical protein
MYASARAKNMRVKTIMSRSNTGNLLQVIAEKLGMTRPVRKARVGEEIRPYLQLRETLLEGWQAAENPSLESGDRTALQPHTLQLKLNVWTGNST